MLILLIFKSFFIKIITIHKCLQINRISRGFLSSKLHSFKICKILFNYILSISIKILKLDIFTENENNSKNRCTTFFLSYHAINLFLLLLCFSILKTNSSFCFKT